MNNLLSYRGLVDEKIRASDKDLPVQNQAKILYFTYAGLELTFHQVMLRILL